MPTYTVIKRGKPIKNDKGKIIGYEKGKSRQVTTDPNRRQTITGEGSLVDNTRRSKTKSGRILIERKSKNNILLEARRKDAEKLEKERKQALKDRAFEEKKAGFLAEVQKVKDNDFVTKRAEQKFYDKLEDRKVYRKKITYPTASEVKAGAGIQAKSVSYEEIIKPDRTPSGVYGANTTKGSGKLESTIQTKEKEAISYNIKGQALKEFKVNTEIFFLQGAKDFVGIYDFVRSPSKRTGSQALQNLGAGIDNPKLSPARFTTSFGIQLGLEGLGGGLSPGKVSSGLAKVVKVTDNVYIPKGKPFLVESGGEFVQLTSKNLGKTIVTETGKITYLDKARKTSTTLNVESRFLGQLGKGSKTQFTTGKGVTTVTDIQGNILKDFTFTTKAQFQNKLGKIGLKSGAVGKTQTSLFEILPSKTFVVGETKKVTGLIQKLRITSSEDVLSTFKYAEDSPRIVKKGFIEETGARFGTKNIVKDINKNFRSSTSEIYNVDTKIFKGQQKATEIFKATVKDELQIKKLGFEGVDIKLVKGGELRGGVFQNNPVYDTKQFVDILSEGNKVNKLVKPQLKGAFLGKKAQSPITINKPKLITENPLPTTPSVANLVSQSIGKGVLKPPNIGVGALAVEGKEEKIFTQSKIKDLSKEMNKEFRTGIKPSLAKEIKPSARSEIDSLTKIKIGKKLKVDNKIKTSQTQKVAQKLVQKTSKIKAPPLIKNVPKITPKKTPRLLPPLLIPTIPTRKSSGKQAGSFGALVKVKGKWRVVGKQNVSFRKAFRTGSRYVQRTSSASFKVVDISTGNFASLPKIELPRAFRKGKKDKDSFVEKNKFRIDTGGEFGEITLKGIQANKKIKGLLKL